VVSLFIPVLVSIVFTPPLFMVRMSMVMIERDDGDDMWKRKDFSGV
jgi:hypothetical protein